jgi:hypothetical protein
LKPLSKNISTTKGLDRTCYNGYKPQIFADRNVELFNDNSNKVNPKFTPPPTKISHTPEQQTITLTLAEYTNMVKRIATLEERLENLTNKNKY